MRPLCSGPPSSRPELERLKPGISTGGLTARFSFRDLGREEIEPFIRGQLQNGEEAKAFTAEAIGAIADFSGGDPALVNRLARIMLDNPGWTDRRQEGEPATVAAQVPAAPRRHLRWAMSIALLLCAAAAGLLITREIREIGDPPIAREPATLADQIAPTLALLEAPGPEPTTASSETAADRSEALTRSTPSPSLPRKRGRVRAETGNPGAPGEGAASRGSAPALAAEELAALVARGEAFVQMRDTASARLYFERAAEAGDGRAALRLGETFDPVFLGRAGIHGAQADRQQAVSWYRRARDLGNADAARLLETVESQDQGRVSR